MLFTLGLGAAASAMAAADAGLLPLQTFFRHADISAAALSPSGRWLAIATGAKSERVLLAVVDLRSSAAPAVVAHFSSADLRSFEWVNDDRLVFNLVDLQSGLGEQNVGPGLYSVRRDGSELRQLIRSRGGANQIKTAGIAALEANHQLIFVPRTGGNEVIVGQYHANGRGEVESITPKRLDVVTGESAPAVLGIPEHVVGWAFNPKGEARAAYTVYRGQAEVFWRGPGDAGWKPLAKFPSISPTLMPVLVDGADQLYVTTPSSAGTTVLKRYDFAAGRADAEPLVSTPGFDFDGTFYGDQGFTKLLGVRVNTDAEETVWLDEGMKKLQQIADAKLPGRINRLSCRRCSDDGALLVYSYSDRDPGAYWVYRPSTRSWQPVGRVRGDVDPAQMAKLDLQRIKARDGEDLPVWVTTPNEPSTTPAPAVVLVHGGPWVRGGEWRWNSAAQFLASRGYVVLEPEYRGSLGFGEAHFRKGWKNWGTTMQDDVVDAVNWAAASGKIDPKRVCIAGASYGGYATLMGVIRYPDFYRCGVAWVAVTDPRLLFEDSILSDSSRESRQSLPEMLGDPDKDAAMLKAAAPVERASEIRVPLLLAFGREDHRVPLEHGTRMKAAMHATGHDPEWIVYEGEGHGWLKVENNLDFWRRVETFLDKQLH